MFTELLKYASVTELDEDRLDEPISVNAKNPDEIATVRDLLRDPSSVRPVRELDQSQLCRVVLALLARLNGNKRFASIGELSPQQLSDEVRNNTVMGSKFLEAVRLSGLMMEAAIQAGKVRPRTDPARASELP